MNKLREAAQAVCDRWDSPNWTHDAPHTAELIFALREALMDGHGELAQQQAEPDTLAAAIRARGEE